MFATVGTGGVELRDIYTADPDLPFFAATSGANQSPTYGFLDIGLTTETLEADFLATSGAGFDDGFTITQGIEPPNVPPVAAFSSSVSDLTATFTSTSTDSDGTVVGLAWDYGDGTTGTSATHTYAAAGTYNVTLQVTDDDGAQDDITHPVTVTDPPSGPVPFATDSFTRSLTGGWGSADTGGVWTRTGSATPFTVDGKGKIRMASAGSGPGATLAGTSTNTEVRVEMASDKAATGGGIDPSVDPRVVGSSRYFEEDQRSSRCTTIARSPTTASACGGRAARSSTATTTARCSSTRPTSRSARAATTTAGSSPQPVPRAAPRAPAQALIVEPEACCFGSTDHVGEPAVHRRDTERSRRAGGRW